MPQTADETQPIETTRRVEFWVAADVPGSFGADKLSEIASSLALRASQLVEPGKAVDHGCEAHEDAPDAVDDNWHSGP